jgi:hypothetical protein
MYKGGGTMFNNFIEKLGIADLPEPYKTIAETCGIDAAVALAEHFGGSQIYFQKIETIMDDLKARLIKEEFNGYNYNELARKIQLFYPVGPRDHLRYNPEGPSQTYGRPDQSFSR